MAKQLPTQRKLALQQQVLLAAPTTGSVLTMGSATTLQKSSMADTAVLTRTGIHLAAPQTCAHTT
jgi:hypothetical protein